MERVQAAFLSRIRSSLGAKYEKRPGYKMNFVAPPAIFFSIA